MLFHGPARSDLLPWNLPASLRTGPSFRGPHSSMCDFGAQLSGTSRRRCPRYFSESWLFCAEVGCFEDNKGASLGEGIGWQLVVPLLLEDSRSHWVQIPLLLTNPLCCPSSGSLRNFEEMQMSRFSPTLFFGRRGTRNLFFFFFSNKFSRRPITTRLGLP